MRNSLKFFRIFIFLRLFIIVFVNLHWTYSHTIKLIINKFINVFLCTLSISFKSSWNLEESSFVVIYFLSSTCRTLKSNKQIYVNQRIIKILKRSAAKRLSWIIRILTSILIINCTLYNQKRTFFNVLSSSWYSHFRILYLDSNIVHRPFL